MSARRPAAFGGGLWLPGAAKAAARPTVMSKSTGVSAFKRTLTRRVPPREFSGALSALWWAKKGEWHKAHRIVMDEKGRDAAWVHAYLHRVEGDDANARYWYMQAHRSAAKSSLDEEWDEIVTALTRKTGAPRCE